MRPGSDIKSLAELLKVRAEEEPERLGFIFLADGSHAEERLNYLELHQKAMQVAAELRRHAQPGERALLYYPAGLDFLIAFFACSYARIVAVPMVSPREHAGANDRSMQALEAVAEDCDPRLVLTTGAILARLARDGRGEATEWRRPRAARFLATDPLDGAGEGLCELPSPDELAFLQYTSGSTTTPKGVMVSHRALMGNLQAVIETIRQTRDGVCVTWLPHFHDMGLGGLLGALYGSYLCVFMSPLAFLARPLRWLRAITRYGGTWSGAPNFAFDLCCKRVREGDLAQLDLSSWQVLANGAEPVRKETIDRFIATFAPAGFRPESLMPSYGLAEAVVFVAGTAERNLAPALSLDARALRSDRVVPLPAGEADAQWHVPCGRTAARHRFRIVDPASRRACPAGHIGEIWLNGPSVAEGYWGRPEESDAVFRAEIAGEPGERWLRTGDLGFAWHDQMVITGRLKDVIIVAGANHYPQDIEATVERCHAAIRPAGVAALALPGDGDRLVVMAEIYPEAAARAEEVMEAIRAAVANLHQLRLSGVALLQPRSLAKTSSGKLRRHASRDVWLAGAPGSFAVWRDESLAAETAADSRATNGAGHPPALGDGRIEALKARVTEHVRGLLNRPDLVIDGDRPLNELGLGSLDLSELKALVEDEFDIRLPLDRMLQGASLNELAAAFGPIRVPPAAAAPSKAEGRASRAFETLINPDVGRLLRQLRMDRHFVRGEGAWLTDSEGRQVLDAIANYGAVAFGHNPPEIWRALAEAEVRREPNLVQPSALDAAGELAERLLAIAPPGLAHVAYANSGAEATEAALKLVRAATGRRRMLSTHGAFHGKTLGALAVTGRAAYQEPFAAPVEAVEFVRFGDAAELERVLAERGDGFAGFIVEPLQGEGGIVEPPQGYLARAAELCRRHGVKLIVDEIQTGLGRTGRMFACEAEGVTPDVLLVAKALGGGLIPIGAVLYRTDCLSADFALKHTSTFAGNTLACRAGLAALDRLTRDDGALVKQVAELGQELKAELEKTAARYPQVLTGIRGRGFLLGLELADGRDAFGRQSLLGVLAEQGRLAPLVSSYLLNVEGVRVAPTLFSNRVVRLEPPLTFTAGECRKLAEACDRAMAQLARRDTAALVNHLLDRPHAEPRLTRPPEPPAPAVVRQDGDGDWAFIAHPLDLASYQHFDESLSRFSAAEMDELSERWAGLIDPFTAGAARIAGRGAAAHGHFFVVPATARHLATADPAAALADIRAAVALARDAGAKVIGLGGYVSIVTGGGADLADMGVALTSGNSFTAVAALQAVEDASARLERPLAEATIAIVGAAGSIGQAVSYLMAERAGRLILVGNPAHAEANRRQVIRMAEMMVETLTRRGLGAEPGLLAERVIAATRRNGRSAGEIARELLASGDIEAGLDAEAALPLADIVVSATSNWNSFLRPEHFRRGAVVCDVSRPRNVPPEVRRERPDVLVFEGGLVEVPGRADLGWRFGLPGGTAFACMCEPMILALEKRYDAAPRGIGVSLDYTADLRRWGGEHGFRLAPLRSFDRPLGEADWRRMRRAEDAGTFVAAGAPAAPRAGP
jgi:acetylornithine/succinyldiaminopimelate/putrescine aminotransferase/acyl-CoA synthetase (AMP-forming)/AMP-acid ligase II/predicted amino acid dehydrogenase/acyl carrier protein